MAQMLEHYEASDSEKHAAYFDGSDSEIVNAFEESAVRSLTQSFMQGEFPKDVSAYIKGLPR